MGKHDYIPRRDGDQLNWLNNFKNQVGGFGAGLGLSEQDITDLQNACDTTIGYINAVEQVKQNLQQISSEKRENQTANIRLIRSYAQRMKKHADYTNAQGEAMGIVGDEHTVDVTNAKPVLKMVKDPHGWRIEFSLKDFFDGVNIYKKLPSAAGFTFLARDTRSPYIDNSPIENGTRYYAYYVLGDDEVGQRSDEAVVSV